MIARPKLKVLFVSQYFHPENFSNSGIAMDLVNNGHEVQVICCVPNYGSSGFYAGYSNSKLRRESWNGIEIERAFTAPRGSQKSFQLLLNYLVYPFAGLWSFVFRRKWRPDVCFVSQPSPVTQCLLATLIKSIWKVPSVVWVQDIWPDSVIDSLKIENRVARRLLFWMSSTLYRNADLVLAQSRAMIPKLISMGIPDAKILYFPNSAPAIYRPLDAVEKPWGEHLFKPHVFNLLYAGNIGESQDFDTLIAAAGIVKEKTTVKWLIAGSGLDEQRAKTRIKGLGLEDQFSFLGRFESEVMPKLFHYADALLVSLRNTPLFSLTVPYRIQCYLACGRPIVACISGEGARVLEESGAAVVAEAGNAAQLADAILQMVSIHAAKRKEMGDSGRRYFEQNFSQDRVSGILQDALAQAAGTTK
jgi:colanic acid biosynthesis glycosyl transferase WcaI